MTFWTRLLIILFALGVVVLGSQPFQNKYGGVFNYIKHKTAQIAKDSPLQGLTMGGGSNQKKGKVLKLSVEKKKDNQKDMDNLKESDRKELNNLLGGL